MHTLLRRWTIVILLGSLQLMAQAPKVKTVELSPAKIGQLYAYAIQTTEPASFERLAGGNNWLTVTPQGLLTGTPPANASGVTTIFVCAHADNSPRTGKCEGNDLEGYFVVRVNSCAANNAEELAWCDEEPARRPSHEERFEFKPDNPKSTDKNGNSIDLEKGCNEVDGGCIVQFDRLHGDVGKGSEGGRLGYYNTNLYRRIHWIPNLISSTQANPIQNATNTEIINTINGSKVFLSGSVLVRKNVRDCRFWSWSVLTQTGDSSNNLYYGPSDLTAFCADERDGKDPTALIVLPAHALWANVYGTRANANDPTWKQTSEPPAGHECGTGKAVDISTLPTQAIQPCDEKSNWFLRNVLYSAPIEWIYNRGTQPGVSQGSISIAPIAGATKSTWDVQTYGSTLFGPGWIGLQGIYEHDRNPKDDLNSFTAAVTYDYRIQNKGPNWPHLKWEGKEPGSPPIVVVRPAEIVARAGPEWSPDSFKFKPTTQTTDGNQTIVTNLPTEYLGRDLNFVMASTLRLPVIFSPKFPLIPRQPSQFTVVPVAGLEGGFRVISHVIGLGTTCTPVLHPTCVPQPQEIFRRVAGVDSSARSPYNITRNFLGDRPLTVDFSYRMRWLSYAEPFANTQYLAFNVTDPPPASGQSAGGRSYTRITFIAPFSAYVQFRATWQHGALPPIFQYVGNQVTLGLTFSNPGSSEH